MSKRNYIDKLKRYAVPSRNELVGFCVIAIVFALIMSWNSWGDAQFDLVNGMQNFFVALLITTTGLFAHHVGQRMAAVHYGFRPEHQVWWTGLLVGLFVAIVSRGSIQLFIGSGLMMHLLDAHRLGWFRYGPNVKVYAMISLWGPIANVLIAGFVKTLELWSPVAYASSFVQSVFVFNLWFAALNLLPIPPLDGSKIMFESRTLYVFIATGLLSYVAMVFFLDIYSYVFAFLIGVISAVLFYLAVERKS